MHRYVQHCRHWYTSAKSPASDHQYLQYCLNFVLNQFLAETLHLYEMILETQITICNRNNAFFLWIPSVVVEPPSCLLSAVYQLKSQADCGLLEPAAVSYWNYCCCCWCWNCWALNCDIHTGHWNETGGNINPNLNLNKKDIPYLNKWESSDHVW